MDFVISIRSYKKKKKNYCILLFAKQLITVKLQLVSIKGYLICSCHHVKFNDSYSFEGTFLLFWYFDISRQINFYLQNVSK